MIISKFLQNRHDSLKIFYNTDMKASNFCKTAVKILNLLRHRPQNLKISVKPP